MAFREKWGTRVQAGEGPSVAFATVWLFFLLLGYFVVRPVRETLSSLVDSEDLKQLFLFSFLSMLAAVPVYGLLVNALPRRWLVRVVYHTFVLCLLVFWYFLRTGSPVVQAWVAWVLFIWISFFGVFATTVFWSVLADMFSSQQAKRLFGFIAAGGTCGALIGSLVAGQLAGRIATEEFLFVPVVMIELGLLCAWLLEKSHTQLVQEDQASDVSSSGFPDANQSTAASQGGLWSAITQVLRSPYLQLICLFIFFVQFCGTQMYFEQANIVKNALPREAERLALFANIDLATQVLTLLAQLFLSSFLLRRFGVAATLLILPFVYLCSFSALALNASLQVMVVAVVIGRATGYGITVPAREVLFTVVDREDKYKSKSFIDTVVLRGSDAAAASAFTRIEVMGLRWLNLCLLPVVVLWIFVSWYLGRKQEYMAGMDGSQSRD